MGLFSRGYGIYKHNSGHCNSTPLSQPAPTDYCTGGTFRGVFNLTFFVCGCRTRKLEPVEGFVCACKIGATPYSTKCTTCEISKDKVRRNSELHEILHLYGTSTHLSE